MGKPKSKVCPDCDGDMDCGATRCRTCYDKQRAENKWPHYRGGHPIKLCPGCNINWILTTSQFCWSCHNLRRAKAWKQAHCTHYWILDSQTNYAVCRRCGAEKQFPTPREIEEWAIHHVYRPYAKPLSEPELDPIEIIGQEPLKLCNVELGKEKVVWSHVL